MNLKWDRNRLLPVMHHEELEGLGRNRCSVLSRVRDETS
jgi:hypothetical protein